MLSLETISPKFPFCLLVAVFGLNPSTFDLILDYSCFQQHSNKDWPSSTQRLLHSLQEKLRLRSLQVDWMSFTALFGGV